MLRSHELGDGVTPVPTKLDCLVLLYFVFGLVDCIGHNVK
jgi:hypothetical protein